MQLAHSVLVLGPSGSGKSSFLRSALKALGGGAVAMAPLVDEANSYAEFLNLPGYAFKGFDDTEFMPSLGEWKAEGHAELLRWLKAVYTAVKSDVGENKAPRYPILGIDTITAVGRLSYNSVLARFKMTEPPAARGGDGSAFYGLLYQKMDEVMRVARAIRGLGVNLVALGHTAERENVSEAVQATGVAAPKLIVPALQGGYRDVLPSFFDNVLHTSIVKTREGKDVFVMQSKPSPKRPTKSRWGNLQSGNAIPNEWNELMARINEAIAANPAAMPPAA